MGRHGVTPEAAREIVRTRRTVIASIMVARGEADAMIAGPVGFFDKHLRHICEVIGLRDDMGEASTLHALVLDSGTLFIGDTEVSYDPPPYKIAMTTLRAAETLKRFGIAPKVALLSHSSFGSHDTPSAVKMREALKVLRGLAPDLEVDGEMHADAALSQVIRDRILPNARLVGQANLLMMPTLDAANIGYNLVKAVTGAVSVGPILVGPRLPAHIVTASVTTRGIVNMSALACVHALSHQPA